PVGTSSCSHRAGLDAPPRTAKYLTVRLTIGAERNAMGTHRKHPEDRLDLLFHALSDRTRRRMLASLVVRPSNVSGLARPFAMSLPAVSKHLKILEQAGLVRRTIDGRVHRCRLEAGPLRSVE